MNTTYERIDDEKHHMFRRTTTSTERSWERDPVTGTYPEQQYVTEVDVPAAYVTVYAVTRHYGGPEEGGWWYDWHEPVCSVPTDGTKADVAAVTDFLTPRFPNEGDIGSVNGGVEYHIDAEPEKGFFATKERPHYE